MRVSTTFGSILLGAGLCAARACAPHPRPTTTTSVSSEVGTTTTEGSTTNVIETTASGSTSQETLTVSESQASVESSATTTEVSTTISSFTTLATTTSGTSGLTSQETETSTTTDDATSTTLEATTTSAGPPVITNIVQNGGFEDSAIDPWEVTGATPNIQNSWCPEGSQCLQLPQAFDDNTAKICQRVEVEQGFEYTFKMLVYQNCIKSFGSNIVSCDSDVNTVDMSIDGVFDSGAIGVVGDGNFHEVSKTFSYVDPSIDSTDLCITITVNQGVYYNYLIDGVSLTQGKAVPIPAETD
ncbi:hypothetical protein FBEOM_12600 [Fusarium beomiforme]|uniref:CBM-cenC domain-containing protein n=1 Tax=Fusarium beomiforme TaxID=44412 RepID=A0A9P5A7X6_9HYPO|nr:hypothetical protein FBEOM_12600 [Fusarium beomiforme]